MLAYYLHPCPAAIAPNAIYQIEFYPISFCLPDGLAEQTEFDETICSKLETMRV